MRPRSRGRGLALAALVTSVLVAAAGPLGAAGGPAIHTPSPRPGALVASATTVVGAWVDGPSPVRSARLEVDGRPVIDVEVTDSGDPRGQRVEADVTLADGGHVLRLEVTDADGVTTQRSWTVTATDRSATRHAGLDRIATAVAISRATFPTAGSAPAAVLARADDFADALAGAPLAASVAGPLLLTGRDTLASEVADELTRVLRTGADVHLLGGTMALAEDVEDAVRALGFSTIRSAGSDRYATAAAVAARLPASDAAILASGASFPDALAASAPAARDLTPVLLTGRDALPSATSAVLRERAVRRLTIVGGTAVVAAEVERQADEVVTDVERIAGPDRYATAVAVLEAYFGDGPLDEVSLASGVSFPDALAGTRHAAAGGRPLLLVAPDHLPAATDDAVRHTRPRRLHVYGGGAAVHDEVATAAVRAAVDGAEAPRLATASPAPATTVTALTASTLRFDREVSLDGSSVYLELAGREAAGTLRRDGSGALVLELTAAFEPVYDRAYPATLTVVAAAGAASGHHEVAFTVLRPHPVYATIDGLELRLPSTDVELVGFHQSSHDGARGQTGTDSATHKIVLPSRGRGTGRTTAADIVANPDVELTAPVTGTVRRAGTYRLYCDHVDHYLVIEPDARPGWEVKLLHFTGLRVAAGDRVIAGETVFGDGPRTLPFASQVDRYSQDRNWPHVHLEVVDPSIPDRPGSGC